MVDNVSDIAHSQYDKVYESSNTYIRNGLDRYYSLFKHDSSMDDLSPYYDQLERVGSRINYLVIAIQIGVIIGVV
jgi:hypothetical protein